MSTALRRTLLPLAMASALVSACKDKAPPDQQTAVGTEPVRAATFEQDSLRDWFIESSVADIPGTEEDITGTLGVPDSVVRLPSASVLDPMTFDTIIEVHYPGLSATILKIGATETLQRVWVSDSTHIVGPVRIGADTADLRRLLGDPMIHGEHPGYICGKCSVLNEAVQFDLLNGKVTGMTFVFPDG